MTMAMCQAYKCVIISSRYDCGCGEQRRGPLRSCVGDGWLKLIASSDCETLAWLIFQFCRLWILGTRIDSCGRVGGALRGYFAFTFFFCLAHRRRKLSENLGKPGAENALARVYFKALNPLICPSSSCPTCFPYTDNKMFQTERMHRCRGNKWQSEPHTGVKQAAK